jgi:hypothetical protein
MRESGRRLRMRQYGCEKEGFLAQLRGAKRAAMSGKRRTADFLLVFRVLLVAGRDVDVDNVEGDTGFKERHEDPGSGKCVAGIECDFCLIGHIES